MKDRYNEERARLRAAPKTWVVTGVAGFIGSHLLQELLELGRTVRGVDDFCTGRRSYLADVSTAVGEEAWARFTLTEESVCSEIPMAEVCAGADFVLHQAALGSVPRSIADPLLSHGANVNGFVTILTCAKNAGVARFVYASSSSVYGDHPDLPKVEHAIGEPLSPYAATKRIDEIYAAVFQRTYGLETTGMRYFNVYGPRQDPNGPYAAVIPLWIATLQAGKRPAINGDGETSRDFCPVANVVQANLLAAVTPHEEARVFNVALGSRTTLNELFVALRAGLVKRGYPVAELKPDFGPFREGDVRHSLAALEAIREQLGYAPEVDFEEGLARTLDASLAPQSETEITTP